MNPTELMLQRLINDPSLMKMLEKVAKAAPKERKAKKLKELGNPCYVNRVVLKCKLCQSEEIVYMCMSWDATEKLYRGSCYHQDNIWTGLPVHDLYQRKPVCKICPETLEALSKEALISKLITIGAKL